MITSPDKLSLIIQSNDFDRVHYGLVLASAALAVGKPVTLFFAMEGTRALVPRFADVPREKILAEMNLATFEGLVAVCAEMKAQFMVCEMGMRAMSIKREQLRNDITITEGSAVSFLADASKNGAMLYI
ncbi:MAG: hypothetical protein CFH41_01355 [Alphaproteobacteria bacterium MarineAlpha11_Bin1]|nr:MAG: hypothetical protein CFH41_01355 [Alphaproteobacteria bacterium MarineAlpha11_Bin1]|tara:strand:- start:7673 stop:8059 length:387 start_codon:yes stop_codon:yes gene_type:complete